MEPTMMRKYGYFYNGFEPDFWWWELLVKRIDTLTVLVVTYTNLVPDSRARLLLYMVFSGIWWAIHNGASPFDDRGNSMLDKIEGLGLRSRFLTFFIIQMLLLFAAPAWLTWSLAALLVFINVCLCVGPCIAL